MGQVLSKNETVSMRGVAILFIVLHNLLHLILPTTENEYIFSMDRSMVFWREVSAMGADLWLDVFSFLGWYGVAVFLFLSGYGLTVKYETKNSPPLSVGPFVWRHFRSVFLLMILPYIPFLILQMYRMEFMQVFLQLSLLSNIFTPDRIYPGIFWFFGLIMQFYLFYAILRLGGNAKRYHFLLILLNLISLIWLLTLSSNTPMLNWVRHNFVGWLLPFSLGIWFAQNAKLKILFDSLWKNLAWLIFAGALVVVSNYNYYAWIFSSVFAVLAAIGLTKLFARVKAIDKSCVWLGGLSAYLFAVHPFVRLVCMKAVGEQMQQWLYVIGYLVVSILGAMVYRQVHKRLFERWLK